jgi:hypothetical protein
MSMMFCLQKILNMDVNDCGKRYVCELGALGQGEEDLLQSEQALLSMLGVRTCIVQLETKFFQNPSLKFIKNINLVKLLKLLQ